MAHQAARHLQRKGSLPHRSWLVVNHHHDLDPDDRPDLVWVGPDEIASFARRGGLVIDTRELFLLLAAVDETRLTAQDAREALAQQQGVFAGPRDEPRA